MFFFFKQKTAYEMRISDWSSDVCSSDLRRYVSGAGGGLLNVAGDLLSGCPLLVYRGGDSGRDLVYLPDCSTNRLDRGHGFLGRLLDAIDLAGDLICCLCSLVGQGFDLSSDHGKALAGFTRACRLDCRIQRQQIGLAGKDWKSTS